MRRHLCFTIRFLQPTYHGRGEDGEQEWPPSPLRLFQSLVAAAAAHWNEREELSTSVDAFKWLETLPNPEIVAGAGLKSTVRCQFYVPDNTADLLVPAWKKGDVDRSVKRTEKVVSPTHLTSDAIHYLFPLSSDDFQYVEILTMAARSISHFGWGMDMVVGDAQVMDLATSVRLLGQRWISSTTKGVPLRVARSGSLDDLCIKHKAFLSRVTQSGFKPVPPLRAFSVVNYQKTGNQKQRATRLFELRSLDGSRQRYSPQRVICLAGMVRHLAIEQMTRLPPPGVSDDWVKVYIAGHGNDGSNAHQQLSYIPLPSIGHRHADPGIRRVMIAAPFGDDDLLNYIARRLSGLQLVPKGESEFPSGDAPLLVPMRGDNVTRCYTAPSATWYSFTPVILDGHVKRKAESDTTDHAHWISKALERAGIEQPCDFEWSAFSKFSKSFSAHKYDKDKRPQGFLRPSHLKSQTAVHLTIRFHDGTEAKTPVAVPGPIAIGAGRHCGLGTMASPYDA
jgi:CRISPR-associated protein Csb2